MRVRFIGRRGGRVPARVRKRIEETEALTAKNRRLTLTFAFNYYFDGHRVIGYHAVNLGIHLAAGLLLFGLLRRSFDHSEVAANTRRSNARIAAAAAVIWLVHPLQADGVHTHY